MLTNTKLHLIKPLDLVWMRNMKKAGLDYWKQVQLFVWKV